MRFGKHVYLITFSIIRIFHIVCKFENREPAQVSTVHRANAPCECDPRATSLPDDGLDHWRVKHMT